MDLDRQRLADEHSRERIRERLDAAHRANYLSDFVYGAIDGTVTTFAVVSGVAGAGLSSEIIIVLGFANLIGDGFSMAASNYLGTRTDVQLQNKARMREAAEIDAYPEGEREEIRQIFASKGFEGEDLERAVETITEDRDRWITTMLTEEMGMSLTVRSPWLAAATTMVAFLLIGLIPLVPFVMQSISQFISIEPFGLSLALTAVAFFLVGATKSRFVDQRWYWSGLETFLVGGSAAALAYLVGMGLGQLTR
ncbi:MAG: VIT1/CCC1 transporter family protein [Planctomycetota bacterium]